MPAGSSECIRSSKATKPISSMTAMPISGPTYGAKLSSAAIVPHSSASSSGTLEVIERGGEDQSEQHVDDADGQHVARELVLDRLQDLDREPLLLAPGQQRDRVALQALRRRP